MVSIIVVNRNGKRFLARCLNSIFNQTYRDLDLWVIDSGSTDGSVDLLNKDFSQVRVLSSEKNMGYCKAFNWGLKMTRRRYVLLLNADTYLESDYVERAVQGMERDLTLGFLSGKILRFDGKTIDSAGQFLGRDRRPLDRGYNEEDRGQHEKEGEIFSVCGAVAFYRREMLTDCALRGEVYDEDYFAFYEDLDLGWRAGLLGWRGLYQPQAVAYHYRWGTEGFQGVKGSYAFLRRPLELKYHLLKNRYLTMIKNDTLGDFLRDLPQILIFEGRLWGSILLFSPMIFFYLPLAFPFLLRAFKKRKILQKKGREN